MMYTSVSLRLGLLVGFLSCGGGCCLCSPKSQYCPWDLMPPCFDTTVAAPLCANDPCYGFQPTCWHSWSPCCPPCPPPGGVCPSVAPATMPSQLEIVPIPQGSADIEPQPPSTAEPAKEGARSPGSGPTPPPAPSPPETILAPPPPPETLPSDTTPPIEKTAPLPILPTEETPPEGAPSPDVPPSQPQSQSAPSTSIRLISVESGVVEDYRAMQNESAKVRVLSKPPHLRTR